MMHQCAFNHFWGRRPEQKLTNITFFAYTGLSHVTISSDCWKKNATYTQRSPHNVFENVVAWRACLGKWAALGELQTHPNLHSPVWVGSTPGRPQRGGANLGVFVAIWPVMSHIAANTPKFAPPRWGRPPVDPTQTGLCKFEWVWSSLMHFSLFGKRLMER